MSTTLAPPPNSRPLPIDGNDGEFDLVGMLLQEQHSLTAVDRFSQYHEQITHGSEAEQPSFRPAQAKYYSRLMPATAPAAGQQLAFEVDLDACSGCKACVVACHTLNGLEEDESWRRVGAITLGQTEEIEQDHIDAISLQHVTTACHHCTDPGCLLGCPVKAYDKDPATGIVRHLDDQCIGCKYCTMMCPYEVPRYSKRLGIVRKCDMCHHRLAVGEAPACVQSCPNEAIAIKVVDVDAVPDRPTGADDQDLPAGEISLAPGAPPSSITRPTTVYKSSRRGDFGRPQDDGIDHPADSHWPLAALLIGTQISVGMLLIERAIAAIGWITGDPVPGQMSAIVATIAFGIGMVGLNLAPLHLGQPLRAWRVFLGLRTSWLSREAIVLGQYVGMLAAAIGLLWLPTVVAMPIAQSSVPAAAFDLFDRWVPAWAGQAALIAAIPVGIAGLYCSAMIYIATGRPLWRTGRTLPRCLGTTLIGGVAGVALVFWGVEALDVVDLAKDLSPAPSADGSLARSTTSGLRCLLIAAAIGSLIKLRWEHRGGLGPVRSTDSPHLRRSRLLVRTQLSGLRTARIAAAVASAGLLILAAIVGPNLIGLTIAVLAMVSVVASESTERLLYFMGVVYDRMPGTFR